MGQKDMTERATGLGRRTKEEIYIEKWDQSEIPDRGETSEIPGLPGGWIINKQTTHTIYFRKGKQIYSPKNGQSEHWTLQ